MQFDAERLHLLSYSLILSRSPKTSWLCQMFFIPGQT